ncbi:CHAP domain-containing protein [Leptolyngbya ohadii]|uniref:CHAP domain-containing protein n=1 Tax=Leptolyngbya ohadii TaxID=1962290 RepID=UPI0015C59978|nr:CHAP domain-containing protein [Leptolyngbya ohadii]
MIKSAAEKRKLLAQIAEKEGRLERLGNANKAGAEIEPYLGIFREAFNQIDRTTKWSDPSIGFDWCCAFVYYCCLRAGFAFPVQPIPNRPTIGFVGLWREWASLPENRFYYRAHCPGFEPQPGDIVLFDRLLEPVALDHIGIVIGVRSNGLVTAEGNVYNRSGIFERSLNQQINGYVRLEI